MDQPPTAVIEPSPQTALLAARVVDALAGGDLDIQTAVMTDLVALDQRSTIEVVVSLAGSVLHWARTLDPVDYRQQISTGLARVAAAVAEAESA